MPEACSHEPSPRVRVAAIILRDGALLLARHEKQGRTYWLLPGGGCEYGEAIGEALTRELKEETNLDIRVGDLVLVNDSIPPDKHRHVLNLYFRAEIVRGELACRTDERLKEVAFVPVSELSGLTFYPDIRESLVAAIRKGFGGRAVYLGNLWKD
jgi:ADP-ribose pyrophosphatase YjhB (NUDIX family)